MPTIKSCFVVVMLCYVAVLSPLALSAKHAPNQQHERMYKNEKAIRFSTHDGKQADALSGFFEVPASRSKQFKQSGSQPLKIAYVRFPSTSQTPGSPIVYLAGGPGGSGIDTAKRPNGRFPLFMAMREFGDVIALDQRGTGASTKAPSCKSSQKVPFDQAINAEQLGGVYRDAFSECRQFWQSQGFEAHAYNTQESAADLNDLRLHLGADKLSLWGISYGSHLALAALKSMTKHIDKMVLASVEGLDQTVKSPLATRRYFERVQAVIDENGTADKRYSDIIALMTSVQMKLDKAPLHIALPLPDGSEQSVVFGVAQLQMLTSFFVSDPWYLPQLLELYADLDAGSGALLSQFLYPVLQRGEDVTLELMPIAMDVASGISRKRLKQFHKQSSLSPVGSMLNFPMPFIGEGDAHKDLLLGNRFRQAPKSKVPTLVFSGTLDGRTYVDSQREAIRGLKNATQVIVHHAGHNLYMSSPEVGETIQAFMRSGSVPVSSISVPAPQL